MARTDAVLRHLDVRASDETASLLRVLLLTYLIDWKFALEHGRQLTDAQWRKAAFGPYSPKVLAACSKLRSDLAHNRSSALPRLTDEEQRTIHEIASRLNERDLQSLQKIANSTYPMVVEQGKALLDLASLAAIYQKDFGGAPKKATG